MIHIDQFERYLRKPVVRNWLEVLFAFIAMRICIKLIGVIFGIPLLARWIGDRQPKMWPLTFVFVVPLIFLFLSIASGWWGLSLPYQTKKPQPANRRTGSASFRYVFGYNNVLRPRERQRGTFHRKLGAFVSSAPLYSLAGY